MCEKETLEELKKLKHFFEMVVSEERDDNQEVGTFGAMPVFFGNLIQYNCFAISGSAMKIIYEYNKDNIDKRIEYLEKFEL